MNIIVAEHHAATQKLLEKHLTKDGYQVFCAQDGFEAWEMVQKQEARIVISDWIMPGLNGLDLCRKIRAAKFPDYHYIIILTAKDGIPDIVEGLKAGADDYITKPLNPEELLARVRSGRRIVDLENQQKWATAHLYQSDKMAAIGQLAAGIAHEINNPTGFIISNINTLEEYAGDVKNIIQRYQELMALLNDVAAPPAIQQKAREIRQTESKIDLNYVMNDLDALIEDCREGAERIKNIVSEFKNFARPGKDELRWTDLNKSLMSTLKVMHNEIKYKATVTTNYGEIPAVNCFPGQIGQAFMNILMNAVQAIENQGEITIATRPLDDEVEITIKDTGAGIEEAHLPKIFDPFFTTKDVGQGTGMGLHVAYNTIKRHGGTIHVRSEAGHGTLFTIRIPVESS